MKRYGFVALAVALALLTVFAWRRHGMRPSSVPAGAVLVGGSYIDCISNPDLFFGEPCRVYDRSTGKLLDTDPFALRLKEFATRGGGTFVDCGRTPTRTPEPRVAECAKTAFDAHRPFTAQYFTDLSHLTLAYGLTGDAHGNLAMATYDSRGFPTVRPTRRTELLDGNRVRLTPCVAPVSLGMTEDGIPACIVPVNEQASASAIGLTPVDTTICAIAEEPWVYNNKLVRIRGHYSGNFEYSTLSGDGCSGSLWFAYGSSGDDDSPPGLVAYVVGGAMPGAEDSEGRKILPVPVALVCDKNFERLEHLMRARVEADTRAEKSQPGKYVSYQVTATFVGRIDGVSPEIRQFHRNRKRVGRADFLGFGQMGLFDAQFVMQSVEGDAVLEVERPTS